MRHRSSRPSPAIIVAVLALIAAVAGTAVAGTTATRSKVTAKKVTKIADREIAKLAPGLSVASAKTASTASTATTADRSSNVMAASFNTVGSCSTDGTPTPGVTVSDGGSAACDIAFPRNISGCNAVASLSSPLFQTPGEATVRRTSSTVARVDTWTSGGAASDRQAALIVVC